MDTPQTVMTTRAPAVLKTAFGTGGFPLITEKNNEQSTFRPRRRTERIANNSKVDRERTSEDWHPGDERMEINLV